MIISGAVILQIIPADGWYARFFNEDQELFDSPLACWALVEYASGEREVIGLEALGEVRDVYAVQVSVTTSTMRAERAP